MKKIFYQVEDPSGSFSIKCFDILKEAKTDVQYNLDGCPSNTNMSDENRTYWKRHGTKLKIYKVTQTTIKSYVPHTSGSKGNRA